MNKEHVIVDAPAHVIREIARQKLKDNWKGFVIAVFVAELITSVIVSILKFLFPLDISGVLGNDMGYGLQNESAVFLSAIRQANAANSNFSVIASIYTIAVAGAVALGMAHFTLRFLKDKNTDVGNLFFGFTNYLPALGLYLLESFIIAIPAFIIGGIIGIFIGVGLLSGSGIAGFLIIILIICFMSYLVYVSLGLAFSEFFLADDLSVGVIGAIKSSWKHMKGNRPGLFGFLLSYFGWAFLAIIGTGVIGLFIRVITGDGLINVILTSTIATIPLYFLTTYLNVGKGVYYKMLVGKIVSEQKFTDMTYSITEDDTDAEKGTDSEDNGFVKTSDETVDADNENKAEAEAIEHVEAETAEVPGEEEKAD